MSAVWTLFHRQARTDSISPRALQVGSPAFLNDNPSYGKHYYLAALAPLVSEPRQELAAQSPQLTPESAPPCGVGATDAKPGRLLACLPSTGPFEGLLLGSLVGKGSFGRVYRGLWRGQLVGVKVGACPQPQGNLAFCMYLTLSFQISFILSVILYFTLSFNHCVIHCVIHFVTHLSLHSFTCHCMGAGIL